MAHPLPPQRPRLPKEFILRPLNPAPDRSPQLPPFLNQRPVTRSPYDVFTVTPID